MRSESSRPASGLVGPDAEVRFALDESASVTFAEEIERVGNVTDSDLID